MGTGASTGHNQVNLVERKSHNDNNNLDVDLPNESRNLDEKNKAERTEDDPEGRELEGLGLSRGHNQGNLVKGKNHNDNNNIDLPNESRKLVHKNEAERTEDDPEGLGSAEETSDDEEETGEDEEEFTKEQLEKMSEEEIKEKLDTYFRKLETTVSVCQKISVTNGRGENGPYSSEFCVFNLAVRESYDYLSHFNDVCSNPNISADFRSRVHKLLLDSGCIKVLCDVSAEVLERRNFVDDRGQRDPIFFKPLKNSLLTLQNYTDASREIKLCVGSHRVLISSLLHLAADWNDETTQKEISDDPFDILDLSLGILHNCALLDENVPLFREMGIFQAVQPYLDSPVADIRLTAVCILANIVNEEEANLLQANPSIYKFLLKTLNKSLKPASYIENNWSAEELTQTLRHLARNDANKKILVQLGCLPPLTQILENRSETEIQEALGCLWVLSFDKDNKKPMMEEPHLVDRVVQKYRHGTEKMKHICNGLLWSLRDHLLADPKFKDIGIEITTVQGQMDTISSTSSSQSSSSSGTRQFKGHVMISYQWANQVTIKRIAKELKANEIPIWLDIERMEGSTLQAMAKAVEDSFAVIVAMSQKYKDSPNTRAEAEYAFQTRKTIIPLIMQQGYRPDGWLGIIVGSNLYFDFSGKYPFESRMKDLVKAIVPPSEDSVDGALVEKHQQPMTRAMPQSVDVPTKSVLVPAQASDIKEWNKEQVKQWMAKYKLDSVPSMTKLTGEELLFLFKLKSESPQLLYHCLETKLKLKSLVYVSRAWEAIADLED